MKEVISFVHDDSNENRSPYTISSGVDLRMSGALEQKALSPSDVPTAIVSAEFGIKPQWPIYSGGLGILAGDWLKEAADRSMPVVGLGVAWHNGYFSQGLENGRQTERPSRFNLEEEGFELLPKQYWVKTNISGRDVNVGAYVVHAEPSLQGGRNVPLVLLTTNVEGNSAWDRDITGTLYHDGGEDKGSKDYFRTAQYRILASGVRVLQKLGYDIQTYHLNDGHGALVALELLKMGLTEEQARRKIWFTTHTLVPAAMDRFDAGEVYNALPTEFDRFIKPHLAQGRFSTVNYALDFSRGVNGVSKLHADVAQDLELFSKFNVGHNTNGIHLPTWVNPQIAAFYESQLPGIFQDPQRFNESDSIDSRLLQQARQSAKAQLYDLVEEKTGTRLSPDKLTVGFARRIVGYKRADLMVRDVEELAKVLDGQIQVVFAGKAPPTDSDQKARIEYIWGQLKQLENKYGIGAAYIPDYSIGVGQAMVLSDIWVNNPQRPQEASGTSGMKVAANGGINLSVLDGWWHEAYNGANGWAIAPENHSNNDDVDRASVLELLARAVREHENGSLSQRRAESMKLASYFNTLRNMQEYQSTAHVPLEKRLRIIAA